jgi:hypothetical protein
MPSLISQVPFPFSRLVVDLTATPAQDVSATEQVSHWREVTVPELSPSDPSSSASSPSSSAPATPLDPPSFTTAPLDPLVHGKHQPGPRPFKPVTKSASRGTGTVRRATQVLLSLGKRKRWQSTDTGISTGVQPLAEYEDASEIPDSTSPLRMEMEPPGPTQVSVSLAFVIDQGSYRCYRTP